MGESSIGDENDACEKLLAEMGLRAQEERIRAEIGRQHKS